MFSKSCEYGIKAIIYIALQSQKGNRVNLKQVASAIDSPVAFTAKTLQLLSKNNFIQATKGAYGGYEVLEEKSTQITLQEIVLAIDGNSLLNKCGLGLSECNSDNPCPIHHQFKSIRADLNNMLSTTFLNELTSGLNNGITVLKI